MIKRYPLICAICSVETAYFKSKVPYYSRPIKTQSKKLTEQVTYKRCNCNLDLESGEFKTLQEKALFGEYKIVM